MTVTLPIIEKPPKDLKFYTTRGSQFLGWNVKDRANQSLRFALVKLELTDEIATTFTKIEVSS